MQLTYLPALSVFDPPDAQEGTLDPLGLSQLATRLAERLAPDFRERVRRPRFLTALVVGAAILGPEHYEGGPYGEEDEGPRYLAWERLLVESYARAGGADADGFIGVPGIDKARQAVGQDARLMSRLYLKNASAAGWWVAYKGMATAVGLIDEEGHLRESGRELLRAWASAHGREGTLSDVVAALAKELAPALAPLLGLGREERKPQGAWKLLVTTLHPRKLTKGEAHVINAVLRAPGTTSGSRAAVIEYFVNRSNNVDADANDDEMALLDAIAETDGELGASASLARRYESVAREVVTAFDCVLFAGGKRADGLVSPELIANVSECGELFARAPERIGDALQAVLGDLAHVERRLTEDTLGWLPDAVSGGPDALFQAIVARHIQTQRRKPPDGKRPWLEITDDGCAVRRRFVPERAPDRERFVHSYRLRAVASCVSDLGSAA